MNRAGKMTPEFRVLTALVQRIWVQFPVPCGAL